MSSNKGQLKVTLTRSQFGRQIKHRQCVAGLGLRRIGHTVTVADTPENRGMIHKINYMVRVEEA